MMPRAAAFIVLLLVGGVAAFVAEPRVAEAKTPGYILTGGDLGEYAMHFYTDDNLEIPGVDAVPVAAPAVWPGISYELYSSWPFTVARQLAEHRPLTFLYPVERLIHNPATGDWLKLSDRIWYGAESWSGVQKAIDAARRGLEAGTLERGPVMAAFMGRGYGDADWDLFGGRGPEVEILPANYEIGSIYRNGLDPRRGEGGQPAIRITADGFPLAALAASLSSSPLSQPGLPGPNDLTYVVSASSRTSWNGIWHTPAFLFYSPPTATRGGRIWEATSQGASMIWESTTEFDRRLLETVRFLEAAAADAASIAPGGDNLPPPWRPRESPFAANNRGFPLAATGFSILLGFAAAIAVAVRIQRGLRRRSGA